MSTFDWNTHFMELSQTCPTLTSILVATLTTKQSVSYLGLSSMPTRSIKPAVGSLTSLHVIVYQRKPRRFDQFQELNALQMWLAGCKRELFSLFSHVGLCVSIEKTRISLDRIRISYDEDVMNWKAEVSEFLLFATDSASEGTIPYGKSTTDTSMSLSPIRQRPNRGHQLPEPESPPLPAPRSPQEMHSPQQSLHTDSESSTESSSADHRGRYGLSLCFDNVNQKVTVRHQMRDTKNKMYNMVQAYAARDRIATVHLPDQRPSPEDIRNIPLQNCLPNEMDEADLRSEMMTLVSRILVEKMPAFQSLKGKINWHIAHAFSKESSSKNEIIPIGVLEKDECKTSDMISIMEEYHKYVPLRPDGEPFVLPLHADGLSCERGNDAHNGKINSNTAWEQLQGLHLNIQEWHKRCILLQDAFDDLYSTTGGRDLGTLFHLRNYFNQRSVTTNIKQSFNFGEEFLDFVTDGYIILSAMHFMDISSNDETPEEFRGNKQQLHRIVSKIVDMVFLSVMPTVNRILNSDDEFLEEDHSEGNYCTCKQHVPDMYMVFCENRNCERGHWFHLECMNLTEDEVPDGKWFCSLICKKEFNSHGEKKKTVAGQHNDRKRDYTLMTMWYGLNQKVRRDAIREKEGS